ncbi:MAG: nucleotidyl transferase AbiEii/AbiGii toxin family protein [Brumimicrobium sp.]
MLSIQEIQKYYPEHLHVFKRFLIREYLQHKILEIVFEGPYAQKLSFLGGTCLRIIHNQQRFSEDLDFDNFKLTENEFEKISENISFQLERLGYQVEIKNVNKGAFHCYIRFPGLLFDEGLSGHSQEKILIQLDTEPHHFDFIPEQPIINKFDVFTQIYTTPLDLLLAQKFYAVMNRKRNKGRDFFDIVFLMGKGVKPNLDYLSFKLGITNYTQLHELISGKCQALDMNEMAKDVAPFLFRPKDAKMVSLFPQYIKENWFD